MHRKTMRVVIVIACLFQLTGAAFGKTTLQTGWIADGTPWKTAYYLRDSGAPGPTLLIVGGVHGNEPAGYRAAEEIRHWPIVRGRMLVIPRANVLGLHERTRFVPESSQPRHDFKRTAIHYQNGPIVSPKNMVDLPRYTVLAWYRTENALYAAQKGTMCDTPAIVCSTFGTGRVISMSPHPESTKGLERMIVDAVHWVAGNENSQLSARSDPDGQTADKR